MPIVDHANVKTARVIVRVNFPDTTVKRVLMVEADMPLSGTDPEFKQAEFDALVRAIIDAMGKDDSIDCAEISDP